MAPLCLPERHLGLGVKRRQAVDLNGVGTGLLKRGVALRDQRVDPPGGFLPILSQPLDLAMSRLDLRPQGLEVGINARSLGAERGPELLLALQARLVLGGEAIALGAEFVAL